MGSRIPVEQEVRPPEAAYRPRSIPTAHRMPWTDQDDEQLCAMVARGDMLPAMAAALGRTREGVRNRANGLGLAVRSSHGSGRRRLG